MNTPQLLSFLTSAPNDESQAAASQHRQGAWCCVCVRPAPDPPPAPHCGARVVSTRRHVMLGKEVCASAKLAFFRAAVARLALTWFQVCDKEAPKKRSGGMKETVFSPSSNLTLSVFTVEQNFLLLHEYKLYINMLLQHGHIRSLQIVMIIIIVIVMIINIIDLTKQDRFRKH